METSPTAQRITVAIVEDDPRLAKTLAAILQRDNTLECVGTFPSGEEAAAKLPGLKPKVVLMDVNLPGMNGVECVRGLEGKLPGSYIIMLTVRADTEMLFESLAAGASGYLLKPPKVSELLAAIHDVFAGGAPMTSSIARKVVESFKKTEKSARDIDKLSGRELDVLKELAKGLAYKEVAANLGITYNTVHHHIESIYQKLHVNCRTQAVTKYLGGA